VIHQRQRLALERDTRGLLAALGAGLQQLERDLPALEETVKAIKDCRLVVIDPVQSYMGGVDDNQGKDVRDILGPLRKLAEKYRVAVVYINHLNRRDTTNALDRIGGSSAYTQVPRVAWIVAKDKDDEKGRVFVQLKNNLAPNPGGMAFRIVDKAVKWDDKPITITADEALASDRKSKGGQTELARASTWLSKFLADGPKRVADIEAAADAELISEGTLRKAKAAIEAQARHVFPDGEPSYWEWYMPGYVICAGAVGVDAQATPALLTLAP
jgi:RecA-family ATPase